MEIEKIWLQFVVHWGKDENYKEYWRFFTMQEAEDFVWWSRSSNDIMDYLGALVSDTADILSILERIEANDEAVKERESEIQKNIDVINKIDTRLEDITNEINKLEWLISKLSRKK